MQPEHLAGPARGCCFSHIYLSLHMHMLQSISSSRNVYERLSSPLLLPRASVVDEDAGLASHGHQPGAGRVGVVDDDEQLACSRARQDRGSPQSEFVAGGTFDQHDGTFVGNGDAGPCSDVSAELAAQGQEPVRTDPSCRAAYRRSRRTPGGLRCRSRPPRCQPLRWRSSP